MALGADYYKEIFTFHSKAMVSFAYCDGHMTYCSGPDLVLSTAQLYKKPNGAT